MNKIIFTLFSFLFFTTIAQAAESKNTYTGYLTAVNGTHLIFKSTNGTVYMAETGSAQLYRKNGSLMKFTEFFIGDKLEVVGQLWGDNSISSISVRDLSLYTHTGSFSGKIISIDTNNGNLTVQSSRPETKIIKTNIGTQFKKNTSGVSFKDIEVGMSANIKGTWERKDQEMTATLVDGKLRLINIVVTGNIVSMASDGITILSGNTIYGIDTTSATFKTNSNKTISSSSLSPGHTLQVTGKHVSGSVKIFASKIKDLKIK